MSTNQISDPVRILMMEYSTNEVVHTWEGDPQSIAGLGFYGGLSKYYYFRFEPYNVGRVNGSGSIFWDDQRRTKYIEKICFEYMCYTATEGFQ